MKITTFIFTCCLFFTACPAHRPTVIPPAQTTRQEKLVITYSGVAGKTVLELLKARADVRTTTSDIGELVEEINGIRNHQNSYLIYYVNGKMAKTGAANYLTETTDKIEWKLITRTTP